jgi:hypothetical protein
MTNEQAKSELMQIYMSLSEEKKKALDVAFKEMEQAIPVMYYPQVDGITPTVVAQADGEYITQSAGDEIRQKNYDSISRQAVLDYIYNDLGLGDEENGKDLERQMDLVVSYKYVKSLPPVTPQPKTGHWIDRDVYDADRWKCSECGRTEPYKENYCPKCGAKMN